MVAYLKTPHDRCTFGAFVELCYRRAYGYLLYLKRRGYRLPDVSSDSDRALQDLSIDVLAEPLAGGRDKPTPQLFEFLAMQGEANFDDIEESAGGDLLDLYDSWMLTHIRQQVSRRVHDSDPATGNLKSRFKKILKTEDYLTLLPPEVEHVSHALASRSESLRKDLPHVEYEPLLGLVEDAYNQATNRPQWCRGIFERVDDLGAFRNLLFQHLLLKTVVTVNARALEVCSPYPARLPGAKGTLLRNAVAESRAEALRRVETEYLAKRVSAGKLDSGLMTPYLSAVESYLQDLADSPVTAPLPAYFRESLPESEHESYLQSHKNLFESAVRKARDIFKEKLLETLHRTELTPIGR